MVIKCTLQCKKNVVAILENGGKKSYVIFLNVGEKKVVTHLNLSIESLV